MSRTRLACVFAVALSASPGCSPSSGRCTGTNCHPGGDGGSHDLAGGGGDAYVPPDGGTLVGDPTTCAEAAMFHTYIGCDYWPTVLANPVWSVFDFAAVVSNPGSAPATVTVTGPGIATQTVTVQPNTLQKIMLPWVPELKGADFDSCTATTPIMASVTKTGGAFHLVSTVPVIVYQFSALEYRGGTGGKWANCPGTTQSCAAAGGPVGCFSYSNDASLLLPSTAMTGNYRIVSMHGVDSPLPGLIPGMPGYFGVTATQDGTTVKVKVSASGQIKAGGSVTAANAGQTVTFTLNAGDVAEVVGGDMTASDLSGSLLQATKPVQVIGGVPCIANPMNACDHIEESVMPAETLGTRYAVTAPSGPNGAKVGHTVRLVGNVDGTTLTYDPAVAGAPATINAGQVVDVGVVSADFVVTGSKEFSVSTMMQSASVVDPVGNPAKGDPSLSLFSAIEQYRLKYVFLAPDDYDLNFADIVAPTGTALMLDGAAVTQPPFAIGGSGYNVIRVPLSAGSTMGVHVLTADKPSGIQVLGYGSYTSYQYPGGLNLGLIAPPPPPIQ